MRLVSTLQRDYGNRSVRAILECLISTAVLASLVACFSVAAAQTPSVVPPCTDADARTRLMESQLGHLLTSSDPDAVQFRASTNLPLVSGGATLATDAPTCAAARAAYDRERSLLDSTYVADSSVNRRVVVIRAGSLAAVLDRDSRLRKSEYYTLFVFNSDFSEMKAYFAY